MTTILLLLAVLLLLVGSLYLVLCHEPMLAAWWYRIVKDPEPLGRRGDLYPPEAAEAPDPVNEAGDEYQRASWFTVGEPITTGAGVPVVPGDWTAELVEAYVRYRRGEDVCAGARREPSPEVQR